MSVDSSLRGEILAVIMLLVEKQELCALPILRGRNQLGSQCAPLGLPSLEHTVPRQKWINMGYKRKLGLVMCEYYKRCGFCEIRHKFTALSVPLLMKCCSPKLSIQMYFDWYLVRLITFYV